MPIAAATANQVVHGSVGFGTTLLATDAYRQGLDVKICCGGDGTGARDGKRLLEQPGLDAGKGPDLQHDTTHGTRAMRICHCLHLLQ